MVDTLIVNANVLTMSSVPGRVREVAVENGLISATGKEGELNHLKQRRTTILDLKDRTLLPGFIDPHLHLRAMAESRMATSLSPQEGCCSIAEIQKRIHAASLLTPPGEWIRAHGYDDTQLSEKRDPNRWDLDEAAPGHPVKLSHRSGYAHVLNSRALEIAGIENETADPDEGIIERDVENGTLTGQFFGLGDFLSQRIPGMSDQQLLEGMREVGQALLRNGLTAVQDASHRSDHLRFAFFDDIVQKNLLQSRITLMSGFEYFEKVKQRQSDSKTNPDRLRTAGVKIILDESSGKIHPDREVLKETVLAIHRYGEQAVIHAIEEPAIEAACEALQLTTSIDPGRSRRHRIEHCAVCPPHLAQKIFNCGAIVVTNSSFLFTSGDRYLETVSAKQLPHLYPVAALLNNRICAVFGSDAPYGALSPLSAVYSAVTRKTCTGRTVNHREKISTSAALHMVTDRAAYCMFAEEKMGRIEKGHLADFVVLSEDPLAVLPEKIKEISVLMTIVGGRVLYSRPQALDNTGIVCR